MYVLARRAPHYLPEADGNVKFISGFMHPGPANAPKDGFKIHHFDIPCQSQKHPKKSEWSSKGRPMVIQWSSNPVQPQSSQPHDLEPEPHPANPAQSLLPWPSRRRGENSERKKTAAADTGCEPAPNSCQRQKLPFGFVWKWGRTPKNAFHKEDEDKLSDSGVPYFQTNPFWCRSKGSNSVSYH